MYRAFLTLYNNYHYKAMHIFVDTYVSQLMLLFKTTNRFQPNEVWFFGPDVQRTTGDDLHDGIAKHRAVFSVKHFDNLPELIKSEGRC